MENGYTYEELQRERLTGIITGIINGLILELTWQDKIKCYKGTDMKIPISHYESTDMFIDKLGGMDDEDYKKFIDKLTDTIIDM